MFGDSADLKYSTPKIVTCDSKIVFGNCFLLSIKF